MLFALWKEAFNGQNIHGVMKQVNSIKIREKAGKTVLSEFQRNTRRGQDACRAVQNAIEIEEARA
jgi:hypothetical protein